MIAIIMMMASNSNSNSNSTTPITSNRSIRSNRSRYGEGGRERGRESEVRGAAGR
ncbi:MAG: hypothetical protein QXS96_04720 [Candidatus Caldarchaeum sp.]